MSKTAEASRCSTTAPQSSAPFFDKKTGVTETVPSFFTHNGGLQTKLAINKPDDEFELEADELADSIAVVDHGKIVARGTADELKSVVGGERIEVIVRERNALARATEVLARDCEGECAVDEHTRKITVPAHGGAQRLVQVVRDLDEAGVEIDDIALRRPTLDEVFLTLTGHAAEDGTSTPEPARERVEVS